MVKNFHRQRRRKLKNVYLDGPTRRVINSITRARVHQYYLLCTLLAYTIMMIVIIIGIFDIWIFSRSFSPVGKYIGYSRIDRFFNALTTGPGAYTNNIKVYYIRRAVRCTNLVIIILTLFISNIYVIIFWRGWRRVALVIRRHFCCCFYDVCLRLGEKKLSTI